MPQNNSLTPTSTPPIYHSPHATPYMPPSSLLALYYLFHPLLIFQFQSQEYNAWQAAARAYHDQDGKVLPGIRRLEKGEVEDPASFEGPASPEFTVVEGLQWLEETVAELNATGREGKARAGRIHPAFLGEVGAEVVEEEEE